MYNVQNTTGRFFATQVHFTIRITSGFINQLIKSLKKIK